MTSALCVIGCDPGAVAGLALAYYDGSWGHPAAYQCDAASAPALLDWLIGLNTEPGIIGDAITVRVGIEEFRPGLGAGARGKNASLTRGLVEELKLVSASRGITALVRPATDVKTWGTDARLKKAGLLDVTAGMPDHSRDACRVLLFTAVMTGGVPDPLSKAGT